MLIFWNLSGVPFAYSFQSVYLLAQGTEQLVPTPIVVGLGCLLVVAYYIWDTANRCVCTREYASPTPLTVM